MNGARPIESGSPSPEYTKFAEDDLRASPGGASSVTRHDDPPPRDDPPSHAPNDEGISPIESVSDDEAAALPAEGEQQEGQDPHQRNRAHSLRTPTISLHPSEEQPEHGEQLPAYSVPIKNGGPPAPERGSSRHFSDASQTTAAVPAPSRQRADSVSTVATNGAPQKPTSGSMVFVITALENIANSKEARRKKQLGDAVKNALAAIKAGDSLPNPEIIFEPLQLATMVNSIPLATTALDCIGKLISYSYFSDSGASMADGSASEQPPLIERAIDTICDCFQGEATPVEVQLQIVKSLLAAVLNDKIVVHGAGLLKAVRQTYNIFLLSKNSQNQAIAQGTLGQMVGTVFERVKHRLAMKETRLGLSKLKITISAGITPTNASGVSLGTEDALEHEAFNGASGSSSMAEQAPSQTLDTGDKITLQSFENQSTFDDRDINDNAPTMVTKLNKAGASGDGQTSSSQDQQDESQEDQEDEIYIKDAFLVFRAMCKLSIKTLSPEQLVDHKSPGMRSKLLSLHLIHNLLNNHTIVFTSPLSTIRSSSNNDPTSFVQATKQYLCLSLSRNGASSVTKVFEVGCEIFWLMLKNLRSVMKKEIEVFLKEIYLAILDKRNTPVQQKQILMNVLERLAGDPRALVEIFLNYDCDRSALDNMFQRIIEHLSRISITPVAASPAQQHHYHEGSHKEATSPSDWRALGMLPPSLSTVSISSAQEIEHIVPPDYALKRQALESLVQVLRSLVNWSQEAVDSVSRLQDTTSRTSIEDSRDSLDANSASPKVSNIEASGVSTPVLQMEDDPSQLEKAKQRKTAMINAIRQFNYKPKRGLALLIKQGFIQSDTPDDIAAFLLSNDQLDKAMIGEYLGDGEPKNIEIMHAFVDQLDFAKSRFVDALRRFLQSFRLPGEAQKIDRFMLKFAERYISGNPNAFANADTAYVLAYSVIMLNTDQHSTKMKGRRMTKEDFIKNNRGINDSADLPDEYLVGIFEEIASSEIVLDTEREAAANLGTASQSSGGIAANIGQALATVGRDLQREAYVQASEEMGNRTEQLFRSLVRAQRRSSSKPSTTPFILAVSSKHVRPIFEVSWMSFFSSLSSQVRDTQNIDTIKLCLEGFKLGIRISCLFDLETPRTAFVSELAKLTKLNNLSEMVGKNVEALKILLDVAQTEGNLLKSSWKDILTCISQLDRFQLISTGVDETVLPDVSKASIIKQGKSDQPPSRRSMQNVRRPRPRSANSKEQYLQNVAEESRSADIMKSVDRIFTGTANMSGEGIIFFIRALSEVSLEEIRSSGQSESPRTFSLQKLVEISYYNMTRVRFEWTSIWQVLGEHFNQVGCHTNTNVVFFALDSLRQLSMRFMEIEELPGFKFQKDFLKPFEHIMANSSVATVKDTVLLCLNQMIQARGDNIRSGWRTMFGVFSVAAKEPYEGIVAQAFENVTQIYNTRFGIVISQGAFADMVVCLTDFAKNMKFQRKALQAIETLKATIPKMLKTPECPLSSLNLGGKQNGSKAQRQRARATQEEQFWFPVLFAFHDILMTGDDLETRSRALGYLFDTLRKYGGDFPPDFWDVLWRQLLYPIFMVLKSKSEMSKVLNHEELSVWLSTTMIQALRNMISLFTHYFESLEYMLDRFLDLLTLCICQENDTIARIGSNCLQQLILQNVAKFEPEHWDKIVTAFVQLFDHTTAHQLFSAATGSSTTPSLRSPTLETPMTDLALTTDDEETPQSPLSDSNSLKINGLPIATSSSITPDSPPQSSAPPVTNPSDLEDYKPTPSLNSAPVVVTAARRRFFNQIITKCVLQLLMIDTVNELFSNAAVYARIPSPDLLRLMALLKKSFLFARRFNGDKDLRMRLWREGFMKQPPNLLKQESGAAATYVSILLRMYHDTGAERLASRKDTEAALVPLCADILKLYADLDDETQARNIAAWRPVVVNVLDGYAHFPEQGFVENVGVFYPLAVELLGRDVGPEVRNALLAVLRRVGEVRLGVEAARGRERSESVVGGEED
ncbi:MAG: guanine nucleotide exchange protein for ADP-robosylation factor [Vezdaea aestivalis]|nr:MAG: guanine nucleotide exchange protein for ADP-robosylation factor [Vezdaea aestivalis]